MKTFAMLAVALAAGLFIGAANPQNQQEESTKKIKELQQERIAVLRQSADVAHKLYRNAQADYDQACEAKLMLHKAEVEAAENELDRIKLYESFVDAMKEYEALADAIHKAARGTQLPVLKARARRLEAEIDLEQAKAKATK